MCRGSRGGCRVAELGDEVEDAGVAVEADLVEAGGVEMVDHGVEKNRIFLELDPADDTAAEATKQEEKGVRNPMRWRRWRRA